MTVAAIIQARMGSTRLPGKILKEVGGRPLLDHMLGRVRAAKTLDSITVATTTLVKDDSVEEYCHRTGVTVFRGSENDVLDRYYQCALKVKADAVVRLTSDCPLLDPRVIDEVVGDFLQGGCDYAANTAPPPGTYPDGMDVEVFSFAALERAWKEAKKPSEREHVTFFFWKNPGLFRTRRHDRGEDLSSFRLTVDYPEDFTLVSQIIAQLQPRDPLFSLTDVVAFLNQHPELRAVNAAIAPKLGWKPALDKDKQQGG